MTKECVGSTPTQCQPCLPGSFTSGPNKDVTCKSCRECDSGKVKKTECTKTTDTQCECPQDTFFDTILLKCSDCTKCGAGQRTISICRKEKDAECATCGKGTYLHRRENKCVSCGRCKKGQTVIEECAPSHDTVCKNGGYRQPTKTTDNEPLQKVKTSQAPMTKPGTSLERDETEVPKLAVKEDGKLSTREGILIGVVVVLVIMVLLLVIMVCKGCRKYTVYKCDRKKDVISTKIAESAIKENNIMFRTVRADVMEKLGHILNSKSGKNWKHLAGLMGYSSTDTQFWNVTPTDATQKLLSDWSTRNGSTVYALYNMLKKLQRDDAAAILRPLLVDQVVDGESV